MECKDKVATQGHLKIQVFDSKTGEELEVYKVDKPNLITKGSKKVLAHLLAQRSGVDTPEDDKLWAIYVGDDNTAPTTEDTDLQADPANVTKKAYDTLTVNSTYGGIVEVEMTLVDTDHPNKYLRECGLFSRGDNDIPTSASGATMLARQVHGEIYKTTAITVKYTWRYQITS